MMEDTKFGGTRLAASKYCLGTMTMGSSRWKPLGRRHSVRVPSGTPIRDSNASVKLVSYR